MQQHRRGRAPPRTPTPATYFQAPRSGLRPARPAGPSRTRSARATRNHERETSDVAAGDACRSGTCPAGRRRLRRSGCSSVGLGHVSRLSERDVSCRRRARYRRCHRPGVDPVDAPTTWRRARLRASPAERVATRRRRRRGPRCALARAGPATSCPARCSTASAPSTGCPSRLARRRPRHRRAQGARGPLRPAGRRPHARAGRATCWCPRGRRCSRPSPELAEMFGRREAPTLGDLADSCRVGARPLLHPRGPAAARAGRARALRRDLLDSGLLLRGFIDRVDIAPTGAIRVVDYKTGRSPGEIRGQGAVPDEVLRAGHLAHPRRRSRDAAAGLPRQRRDRSATSPTSRTCSPPSARCRRCGRRSGAPQETRRLAAQPGPAVRLVRPPGDLPGLRRHSAAAARVPVEAGPSALELGASAGRRVEPPGPG